MNASLVASLAICGVAYFAVLYIILKRAGGASSEGGLAEFLVSGRNVGLATAVATLGATEIGLITIAYNAQKGLSLGYAAFAIGVAAFIGCVFVGLTGFIVAPLRRTGVLTIPEFYGQRYGQDVRVMGAVVMALGGILNMGLFLKVAALFIVALLGLEGGSTAVNALMGLLLVVAVAYTSYGGIRSVIATDVLQFVLIVAGLLVAILFLLPVVGIGDSVAAVAEAKGREGFDPFAADGGLAYFAWMILVAGIVSSAVWPTALSRALCIRDEKTVRQAYLVSALVFMGRMIFPAFLGVLALAYFAAPDSNTGAQAAALRLEAFGGDDRDLVALPVMLAHALPGWLVGLLAIVFFASFMSTQDGYLFCWSSIIARDVLGPLTGRTDDAGFQILATRIGIVLIALYELYWGLIYEGREDIWDYLAVSGSIYFCSGIVLLAGGLYWKRASRLGAWAALCTGFLALAGLAPVKAALGLEAFSAPAIGFGTILISATAFVVGSLLDPSSRSR